MKQKFTLREAMAATAAWPFGARNSCRAAGLRPETAARAAGRRTARETGESPARRRGAGGIPECRQIHADLSHLGGAAEDRGLSFHHARTTPRRGFRRAYWN